MFISRGTAVITGAASNVGIACAERLAHQGYDLTLIARDRQHLLVIAARITDQSGRSVEVLAANLALADELTRVEAILRRDASITLLVNHIDGEPAGLDSRTLMALGVIAPARLADALAAGFSARGTGSVINAASVAALVPCPFSRLH
ncbi:SDR family NAD(P)-dependent oxidoreductase [Pseudomonas sp. PB120]|uniref:SDR family NAD(P)-dependent oxidoreductase n=1 Tax=Pseudomonas sp. PB120 TaxID=2494700 RepID=UPI0012FDE348|nr:SDR family NAD(P)-dependent oxidoreductase [Pseudomonas sp. PB120]MVV52413.1 SDR family NAD(P)-dependent oxidoreductase [Pseudomonas sp. PB120]